MMKNESRNAKMIDVNDTLFKPTNMVNSAVLRAVEEEEHEEYGYKRVAWPPVTEATTFREFTPQPAPQPPLNDQQPGAYATQPAGQGGQNIQSQQNYQSSYSNQQLQQRPSSQQEHNPQEISSQRKSPQPLTAIKSPTSFSSTATADSVYKPNSYPQSKYPQQSYTYHPQHQHHQVYQPSYPSPEPIYLNNQQQHHYQNSTYFTQQDSHQQARPRWGHVASPVPKPTGYTQNFQQPQAHAISSFSTESPYGPSTPQQGLQHHQNQDQQHKSPQQHQQQQQQQPQYRDASPGIITLRQEAPISQKPAPVFTSQPATARFGGGANMRGDLKWPPAEYKAQAEAENEERRRVAQGPVCRPRRINKDYTKFFAKNALSHHYPSYKVPPGTQHMYSSY